MLDIKAINKNVEGRRVLKDVSFSIPNHTVVGIIGPSGAGKTTLLRCMNGLASFDSGAVVYKDIELSSQLTHTVYQQRLRLLRQKVGMVFQHLHLFPHFSVLQNLIEAPLLLRNVERGAIEAQAIEFLRTLGIEHTMNRYPPSLSGGEQQRVAIIRALLMDPEILLMDEPTSALDPQRSLDIRQLLRKYVDDGHTIVIVSHSIGFLNGLADHVVYMEAGEVLEFDTSKNIFQSPSHARTKWFLEHSM